jgi:hypothetical protein
MTKEDAEKFAQEASVAGLISGSLTFFGNAISINATVVEPRSGKNLVTFAKTDSDKDKLFAHISEFADQAAGAFVKTLPEAVPVEKAPAAEEKTGIIPAPVVPVPPAAVVPAAPPSLVLTKDIRRSQDIDAEVGALAVGDVDGDGKQDIVFSERHRFTVASFTDKTLDVKKKVDIKNYLDILFIDAFDANKNGIDEIFITAVHSKTSKLSSIVYEWNGKEFQPIKTELPYFLRKGKSPETGKTVLLGQDQSLVQGVFGESIYEMIWSAGRQNYIPLKVMKTPEKNLYIYGMETGDLKNDGQLSTIVYMNNDRLALIDFRKQSSWKSPKPFEGTDKYIESNVMDKTERYYFPPRLLAGDFDNNKTQEFAMAVNANSSPRIFNNLRNYTQGRVECFEWKNLSFETVWKTPDVSGYIPDFYIADLNGDGVNDVIYPVVTKSGMVFTKYVSYIVVQPVGF